MESLVKSSTRDIYYPAVLYRVYITKKRGIALKFSHLTILLKFELLLIIMFISGMNQCVGCTVDSRARNFKMSLYHPSYTVFHSLCIWIKRWMALSFIVPTIYRTKTLRIKPHHSITWFYEKLITKLVKSDSFFSTMSHPIL